MNDEQEIFSLFQKEKKPIVNVFIFSQNKTHVSFDKQIYQNYHKFKGDDVVLISKDYEDFKDTYSLEHLLKNFSEPEVLDH